MNKLHKCTVTYLDPDTYLTNEEFLKVSPLGKTPALLHEIDSYYETNTILRHIARIYPGTKIMGFIARDQAQVDQFVEYIANELDPLLQILYFPHLGLLEPDNRQVEALENLKECLRFLEKHVKTRGYLVGFGLTLADIILCVALSCPFKEIFDAKLSSEFTTLSNWLNRMFTEINLDRIPVVFRRLPRNSNSDETGFADGLDVRYNAELVDMDGMTTCSFPTQMNQKGENPVADETDLKLNLSQKHMEELDVRLDSINLHQHTRNSSGKLLIKPPIPPQMPHLVQSQSLERGNLQFEIMKQKNIELENQMECLKNIMHENLSRIEGLEKGNISLEKIVKNQNLEKIEFDNFKTDMLSQFQKLQGDLKSLRVNSEELKNAKSYIEEFKNSQFSF
jgi:glutathione S-transferase